MRRSLPSLLLFSLLCSYSAANLQAHVASDLSSSPDSLQTPSSSPSSEPSLPATPMVSSPTGVHFQPFTGKITKDKVRLRLQPTYDGTVIRELNRNDLVVILGETEDFYAIQSLPDIQGYVFRTYVLDHVIEGNRVNVRLKPELDAPILLQLNSGDRVEGSIDPTHTKWLQIKLPETARFYIAKEYIEKVGDAGFKARLEKKREEGEQLLHTTHALSKAELQKPFEKINIEGIKGNYQHLIQNYPEFPELAHQSKEALATLQEAYIAKKLAYLESQAHFSSSAAEINKKLAAELQAQKSKVAHLEQQMEKSRQHSFVTQATPSSSNPPPAQLPLNMSAWLPVEDALFHQWSQQTGNSNLQDFYDEQRQQGFVLRGMIDPYQRPVKNKPGDYMLIDATSKLPIAFLYSTRVNLQDYLGHEIAIVVSPRDNHHFAFPAYFVLDVE